MAELYEPVFDACYLFLVEADGTRKDVIVETQADYDARIEAGWRPSLADFGVETHPSTPEHVVSPTPYVAGAPSGDFGEVILLLAASDAQQQAMDGRVSELEQRVGMRETETLEQRVSALETAVRNLQLLQGEPQSREHGRRH